MSLKPQSPDCQPHPPALPAVVTHGEVYRLAWPMIVSNCSVPLLGIVDTALLGHLPSPVYLGAVAVGSSMLTFLLWAFGFLRMGTTGQVAQAHGKGDHPQCATLLLQSAFLAVAIALTLLVASPLIFSLGIYLMGPSAEVAELTRSYATIRIFGSPATLITYVLIGWFIGMQRTREPLIITLFVNGTNILLDWLFILVLGLNSNGAAAATVIAEYGGLALGLILIGKTLPGHLQWPGVRRLMRDCGALLAVHGHLFVRTLCLLFVFAFFTSQGARQGEVILAANAILLQLLALVSHGLDGYAHAAEALVGKTAGARDLDNFNRACRYTAQWSLWTALGFTLVYWLGQHPIIALFTDLPTVAAATSRYFPWLLALPLISFVSYWLDGVFIGAGKTAAMRNTIVLACFGIYLPLWALSTHLPLAESQHQSLGNHGLWLAFIGFAAGRGLIMTYYYKTFKRQNTWFE